VLADGFYQKLPFPPNTTDAASHIPAAVKTHPTILFLHGNAASRAAPARVQVYSALSSRVGANVLAIDYRGFGDSSGGPPSEEGLGRDARAAWEWLRNMGAKGENILVVGHSLGTAIATRLVAELAREDVACRGVVLLAPFSSMRQLLETYTIFGVFPIKGPIRMIPGASSKCAVHVDVVALIVCRGSGLGTERAF
jgi:abhydrolase domain-containing protein 12